MDCYSSDAGFVRPLGHLLNPKQTFVRLAIVTVVLHSSGCAVFSSSESTVVSDAGYVSASQAIDAKTQAEACRRTAVQLAAHEKDDHAIAQLERARDLDPRIKGVAHLLAVLYDRQGRMDAAEREYQRAIQESKSDADVLNDYGYFLYSRGNLALAEETLRLALRRKNDHPKAQLNLGLVLAGQGRMDESFTTFEKAVGPAAAYHNVGLLMIRNGQREEGLAYLALAAQEDPSLQSDGILTQLTKPDDHDGYQFTSDTDKR